MCDFGYALFTKYSLITIINMVLNLQYCHFDFSSIVVFDETSIKAFVSLGRENAN